VSGDPGGRRRPAGAPGAAGAGGSPAPGDPPTRSAPARPRAHALSDDDLEDLAIAYHRLYREQAGPGDAAARLDWGELPENLRESNRTTARALRRELAALGYDIRHQTGDGHRVTALPPEHVQQLAEAEHARWVREKQARGYVYGPVRRHEGARRTHPDLVAWAHLTPAARDKDRVRFSAAPRLLAALGYEIVRRDGHDG
jgi:hypothetical protein